MNVIISLIFFTGLITISHAEERLISVQGRISDFRGNPISEAVVHFEDKNFKPLYTAYTDVNGHFSVEVANRSYTIFAVKDHGVKYLEYWHWNYIPRNNRYLEIKIDGIELYGMKVWSTEPAHKSLILYIRPMSLKRWIAAGRPRDINPDTPSIAPIINRESIVAKLNGESIKVLGINSVKEYVGDKGTLDAFLISLEPKAIPSSGSTLCLTLNDLSISEYGMGCIDL